MKMPTPDAAIIQRRREIAGALRRILPTDSVIDDEEERRVYESDGLTAYRELTLIVALPPTTAEVSAVLAYCNEHGVKIVPRGGAPSLSGGALPLADGI